MNLHMLIIQIVYSFFLIVSASGSAVDGQSMVMPNCPSMCGNVSIPYPFGIGKGCYHDEWFAITCNNTFNPNKPFLSKFNMEVLGVVLYNNLITVMNPVASNCERQHNGNTIWSSTNFSGSPYAFSFYNYNKFVVVGCDPALLYNHDEEIMIGCLSRCEANNSSEGCLGIINCCESKLSPLRVNTKPFYTISIEENTTTNCTYAFLMDEYSSKLTSVNYTKQVPVNVYWGTKKHTRNNMYCENFDNGLSHYCQCLWDLNITGNPYLPNGCKIPKACAYCKGDCEENQYTGEFQCGYKTKIILGSTLGGGLFFLLLCCFCFTMFKLIKKKRITNVKKKLFKRNGGLLLQQQISSNKSTVKETIIFTSDELLKATDNYNENRILGQGGQGTVYKGMLTDGRITAVKKSKLIDESQLEHFINEVVILSQINHRNIVQLLGCCLETEVPLLVYEFVPNGNIFALIHNENEEFPLSWKMRLQIALEVAGGIAYLHSASSVPIYHRDIKSTNILLDEKFRAKISDFGTSRSIAIEQTHLTTLFYGTFGYLDPEYFQSSQFTDKSDVYSFGVVLAELLTGQRPISPLTELEEDRSLATLFILCAEQMRVFDMIDARILKEAAKEEIISVCNIARQCLNLNGKKRPTMKEVMMHLDSISRAHSTFVPKSFKQDTFNIEKNKSHLDHGNYSTSSSHMDQLTFYTH